MIARHLRTLPALFAVMLFATVAVAQNPAPGPQDGAPGDAAQRPHRAMPAPVNLQVLPKDMSREQVLQIMHHFTGDLGVECSFCHAKDPATGRMDFPSDANPMKNRARVMMRMTHAIDTTYLTQLNLPQPATPVGCGTCHRGMAEPPAFVPPPEEHGHHHMMPPASETK